MDSSTNKNMDPLVAKWLNIQVSDSRILHQVCVSVQGVSAMQAGSYATHRSCTDDISLLMYPILPDRITLDSPAYSLMLL